MEESEHSRTTREEDDDTEAVVLRVLLSLHPARLMPREVVREIAGDGAGFAERDAVERAVRSLVASGLLHRDGEMVEPTRAALRFGELLDR